MSDGPASAAPPPGGTSASAAPDADEHAGIPEEMRSASTEVAVVEESDAQVAVQVARMRTENARLRGEARRALAESQRYQRELERFKKSTSYVLGSMLVAAAKSPRRLLLLPRDVWRLWRLRRARRSVRAPVAPPARAARTELLDYEAARLLLPRVSVRADRPFAIAGALSRATSNAWSPYAAVTRVTPHNAADLLRDIDPDVVILESASAGPGEDWSHLGSPAAVDREAAALELIEAARERGRPVVLLRNTSPAHTVFLADLARRCDLVLDGPGSRRSDHVWHVGTDLAAWRLASEGGTAAVALTPGASAHGLAPSGSGPAQRDLAAALERELRARGVDIVSPVPGHASRESARDAIAAARIGIAQPVSAGHSVVGADPRSLAILAAGLPLLTGPDEDLLRILGDAAALAHVTAAPTRVADAVAAALAGAGPHDVAALSRRLTLVDSVPVRLGWLARELQIPVRPESVWDVTALFRTLEVDLVLAQSWLPREIIVDDPTDAERDALTAAGISVIRLSGTLTDEEAAQASSSPFVATDVDVTDPDALLGLLAEITATGRHDTASPSGRMRRRS